MVRVSDSSLPLRLSRFLTSRLPRLGSLSLRNVNSFVCLFLSVTIGVLLWTYYAHSALRTSYWTLSSSLSSSSSWDDGNVAAAEWCTHPQAHVLRRVRTLNRPHHREMLQVFHPQFERLPTPRVTYITSALKPDQHLQRWLADMRELVSFNESAELLFVSASPHSLASLNVMCSTLFDFPNIQLILLETDIGLYETWNMAAQMARGEFLSNWNLDDGKHPQSLLKHVEVLQSNPHISVVSSIVSATSHASMRWGDLVDKKNQWFVNLVPADERIGTQDFFVFDSNGRAICSRNFPHNSPMWRKSIHRDLGSFTPSLSPVSDWEFWLRAVTRGFKFYHIEESLEVYYVNPTSISRQNTSNFNHMQSHVLAAYSSFIQYRRMRVLIVFEELPTILEGGELRMMNVIRWFAENNFDVYFVSRDPAWRTTKSEDLDRLKQLNVIVFLGDMRLKALISHMREHDLRFDIAIATCWFWRKTDAKGAPIGSIPEELLLSQADDMPWLRQRITQIYVLSDDIHYVRNGQIGQPYGDNALLKKRETSIYKAAHVVLCITFADCATMNQMTYGTYKHPKFTFLPYFVYSQYQSIQPYKPNTFNSRSGLLWFGRAHDGNSKSVGWFIEHVLPTLRKQGLVGKKSLLSLVGDVKWDRWANNSQYVRSLGDVDEQRLAEVMRSSRIFISPEQVENTGVSTKIIRALSSGLPVITTSNGNQGLSNCANRGEPKTEDGVRTGHCGPAVLIADTPEEFAAALRALRDKDYWEKASEEAVELVQEYFSERAVSNTAPLFRGRLLSQARTDSVACASSPEFQCRGVFPSFPDPQHAKLAAHYKADATIQFSGRGLVPTKFTLEWAQETAPANVP